MASKGNLSTTGQGIVAPVVSYASGKEVSDVAPHLIRVIPEGLVGGSLVPSGDIDGDEFSANADSVISGTPKWWPDGPPDQNPEEPLPGIEVFPGWDAPTLFDVELVSNEVVYDSAGKPSVKVIFKVKVNEIAKGRGVKAVNARVKVL